MTIPSTQTAWLYTQYGPKENLSIAKVKVPEVAPDQVLVKVKAAALNPVDWKRRIGDFQANDAPFPTVPGFDVAGVVVQAGREVTKFKVGDKVYGDIVDSLGFKQFGSLAEYTAVEERLIAEIPENLSFEEAASLPLALETAYQALQIAKVKEGQTLLVLGGAGGVGTLLIQVAKHIFKASVVAATTSTPKVEFLRSLGADVVIDYKKESLAEHPHKYDVVYDCVGNGDILVALKEGGIPVDITYTAKPPIIVHSIQSKGSDLETLKAYIQKGVIKPIIDPKSPFKFSEVVEAFGYLETGRATGKVVISPIP